MTETRHLYTELAWLWPMWGDARVEYAQYCLYVTELIQKHVRSGGRTPFAMSRTAGRCASA